MARRPPTPNLLIPNDAPSGPIGQASAFLGYFRWLFMPLGLFALIAIGVHAAADTVDDRIRFVVEQWDAWLDGLLGGMEWSSRYVDAIGPEERTVIARAFTLLWELAADLVIAWPAFGYMESDVPRVKLSHHKPARGFRELLHEAAFEPTTMRLFRPLFTLALVLAGACAVGRMVQSSAYLSLRPPMGDAMAGSFARLFAVAAIAGVMASFGGRAALRNLQHADDIARKDRGRAKALRFTRGLLGTLLVFPLAVAAFVDATPLLSFFR